MAKMEGAVPSLTPAQCRAARSLLSWSQHDLAEAAFVTVSTVKNFEVGRSRPLRGSMRGIVSALEAAGIAFVNGEGEVGVTMPKAPTL